MCKRPWLICLLLSLTLGLTLTSTTQADVLRSFAGFTRPGTPNDTVQDSKVIAVSTDQKRSVHALGGTVYFMVFEKSGNDPKDPWNTGIRNFVDYFNAGVDFGGSSSPMLDREAKYLYLYQTVNDRGTEVPIRSTSFELLVDLKNKEITSWGDFTNASFVAPLKQVRTEIRPVSLGHNVARGGVDQEVFRNNNQAHLGSRDLSLQLLIKDGKDQPMNKQGGLLKLVWEELNPPTKPDYVMLLASSADQRPMFRAIWSEEKALKKGRRSTVFGFTSNLEPKLGSVRLGAFVPKKDAEAQGVAFAVGEDEAANFGADDLIPVAAVGEAPMPIPDEIPPLNPVTPAATTPPSTPSTPGGGVINVTVVGGGQPTPMGNGNNGGGGAPLLLGGNQEDDGPSGGGIGGATGGGGVVTTTQTTQPQSTTTSVMQSVQLTVQSNVSSENNNRNNNNNSNRNRNNNRNTNTNTNNNGPPGEVVPAPASLLLALVGLPGLVYVARRRRSGQRTE